MVTQREEARAQEVELRVTENDLQVLKQIKKLPLFSRVEFRIVVA